MVIPHSFFPKVFLTDINNKRTCIWLWLLPICGMLGILYGGDVWCSGCGMLGTWDVREVGCSGCGMLGMWNVGDVGCWGCWMLGMRDVGDVGYSTGGMFGMWDVRDVGCSGCGMFGMWDVECLPGCGMLIYKMLFRKSLFSKISLIKLHLS